ncbi:energy transducer TonB [Epilithonimonas hispanica]|uniref:Energy transducer TonB n=1 Tax=Epilithonimonas hispanica TaxID=358687 RepID=A0A3D9D253_9FLAO|nr:energy transducer TonB [Epilithonimonas hispanica]REC72089.1 energy transducer TonB [Epilithonimonas hispanica]
MADENLKYDLSLDEIVFENRNKEYGAYDLRTAYPKLLTRSFLIGTAFFILLAVSPLVYLKIQQMNAKDKVEVEAELVNILEEEPILEQPKEEEPPPPPPPKEPEQQEVIQNVVPEPKKAPKIETPPPPITKQLETTTGLANQEGVKTPAYTPPPPPPSSGTGKVAEVKINTNEVYESVDQNADYPGGLNGVRRFIADNVDTSSMEGEGQLTVKLKFIVERDGTVSDVRVTQKSGNSDFDSETIRVVKKLKKWTPAKKNGENVRSYYSIPVTMQFQ